MSAATTLALAANTSPNLGDLFPGLDLSTTQAQQAVLAGLVAGGIAAEAENVFMWDDFLWGAAAGVGGTLLLALAVRASEKRGERRGR